MSKKLKKDKRYQMSIIAFLFFSIAGGGFVLKGIVNQFTEWGNNTFILYLIATVVYAVPFLFMIFEFMSLKSLKKSESGYQTWLNVVLGKKYGFFGGFFYFFVNLFYFLDLIPAVISYFLYLFLNGSEAKITLDSKWFKPIIAVIGVILFWIATFVSIKGPKWLSKITSISGFAGFIMVIIFIFGAFIALGTGTKVIKGVQANFKIFEKFDVSWSKIGAISWALQSLGGMESLAAYKNNVVGGQKGFKKAVWSNLWIFTSLVLLVSILVQYVVPAEFASGNKYGIVGTIYLAFEVINFPWWWQHIVAFLLLVTTLGGSLMMWTAAPAKILFTDAPKGIFGKKLSKTSNEGTPINALILQAIIVSILITIFSLGQLNNGINKFLKAIRNIDGGAAGIPVLFMIIAYTKMRIQKNNIKYERTTYFLGKNPIWSLLAIMPMFLLFLISNFMALVPSPDNWKSDLTNSLIHILVGLGGIVSAFIFCEWRWRVWRKLNPKDNSFFNEIGDHKKSLFDKKTKKSSINK